MEHFRQLPTTSDGNIRQRVEPLPLPLPLTMNSLSATQGFWERAGGWSVSDEEELAQPGRVQSNAHCKFDLESFSPEKKHKEAHLRSTAFDLQFVSELLNKQSAGAQGDSNSREILGRGGEKLPTTSSSLALPALPCPVWAARGLERPIVGGNRRDASPKRHRPRARGWEWGAKFCLLEIFHSVLYQDGPTVPMRPSYGQLSCLSDPSNSVPALVSVSYLARQESLYWLWTLLWSLTERSGFTLEPISVSRRHPSLTQRKIVVLVGTSGVASW